MVVVVVVGLILGFASFASSIDQAGQNSSLKEPLGFGYFKVSSSSGNIHSLKKFPTRINYKFAEELQLSNRD